MHIAGEDDDILAFGKEKIKSDGGGGFFDSHEEEHFKLYEETFGDNRSEQENKSSGGDKNSFKTDSEEPKAESEKDRRKKYRIARINAELDVKGWDMLVSGTMTVIWVAEEEEVVRRRFSLDKDTLNKLIDLKTELLLLEDAPKKDPLKEYRKVFWFAYIPMGAYIIRRGILYFFPPKKKATQQNNSNSHAEAETNKTSTTSKFTKSEASEGEYTSYEIVNDEGENPESNSNSNAGGIPNNNDSKKSKRSGRPKNLRKNPETGEWYYLKPGDEGYRED